MEKQNQIAILKNSSSDTYAKSRKIRGVLVRNHDNDILRWSDWGAIVRTRRNDNQWRSLVLDVGWTVGGNLDLFWTLVVGVASCARNNVFVRMLHLVVGTKNNPGGVAHQESQNDETTREDYTSSSLLRRIN